MPNVRMPDGVIVRFPDDMPPEQIKSLISQKFPDLAPQQQAAPNLSSQPNLTGVPVFGPMLGAIGYDGLPKQNAPGYQPSSVPILDPINSAATGFLEAMPVVGPTLRNMSEQLDALTFGETPEARRAINDADMSQYSNAATAGSVAGTVAPIAAAGATQLGGKLLGFTGNLVPRTAASVLSTLGIGTADKMARGEEIKAALLSSLGPAALAGAFSAGPELIIKGVQAFGKTSAPTVDALKGEAGQLYDAARNSGVTMNTTGTITLADDMYGLAQAEGIISPTGRVTGAYPKITEALKTFDDFASGGSMDVTQMQAVRRTLKDAAASADAGEQRIGKMMLEKFDDFVNAGVPQLREANAIYHRAKKGELIDTAIELAGSRAGQFTGSGFENALRTEFRALDRQIIKGTLKGITAEEAAAIKRVANGGPMENIARWFGKFAPTGVVSTAATAGGLFAGANAFGGPVAGTIAAGTGVGAGLGGRAIATALQKRNAEIASALMRRGGAAVPSKSQQAIIAALSAMAPGLGLAARGLSMQGGD